MLNQKRVEKWIEALRSGEYKQAKEGLRRVRPEDGYCCLGVAADVYRKTNKKGKWILSSPGAQFATFDAGKSLSTSEIYGTPVFGWLGLDGDIQNQLIGMNDSENKSFKQIAKFLEKKLKEQEKAAA